MRRQSLSAHIAATAVIGLPAANAVAAITASPPGSSSTKEKAKAAVATKTGATTTGAKSSAPATEHTYVGSAVEMDQRGPVTVTIVVESGKIVDVSADMPMERAHSNFINSRIAPFLSGQAVKIHSTIDKAGIKP